LGGGGGEIGTINGQYELAWKYAWSTGVCGFVAIEGITYTVKHIPIIFILY
jgi:hypothetical protein